MKPIIGITANISPPNDPNRTFSKGVALHLIQNHYIQFVETGGGIPVILPVITDTESIAIMVERIDGIICTGGVDLDPLFYNQTNRDDHSMGIDPRRDRCEMNLILEARRQDKALLGICRGLQVMNVAMGGDLYQDIPSQLKDAPPHMFMKDFRERYHSIRLIGESFLSELFGNEEKVVNSSHHQSIKNISDELSLSAVSDEGIVEAVECKEDRCTVGVQWHPERMIGNYPAGWENQMCEPQARLAKWFVKMAEN